MNKSEKSIFNNSPILFDCSRIRSHKSGLGRFAIASHRALTASQREFLSVGDPSILPFHVDRPIPQWLNRANASIVKPFLWFAFSRLFFPATSKTRIFSVMQNRIPISSDQVVTVHDLRPMTYPDNFLQSLYWKHILPRSLKKAKAIITVSNTSKAKLQCLLGIPGAKIFVVSNTFEPPINLDLKSARKPRLLCVGCNWTHKNIHEFLDQSELWAGTYSLDIVSSITKYTLHLEQIVKMKGLGSKVTFHRNVTDSQLMSMYKTSAALIYPSLDEGFGIPPLEAMALGTPVIASDIPVFHEIIGAAPIYVRLGDPDSWRAAFRDLEDPAIREERIKQGYTIAANYPFSRCATELNDAISQIWPDA